MFPLASLVPLPETALEESVALALQHGAYTFIVCFCAGRHGQGMQFMFAAKRQLTLYGAESLIDKNV